MLDVESLIVPLLFLLITCIILGVYIYFLRNINNKQMNDIINNIKNEFDNYKNDLKTHNDNIINQISKNNSGNSNVKSEKNLMNIFMDLSGAMRENCISAMNKIDASRIAIYLFHNGTHSTHGINFVKLSCMCEKVAIGSGIRERMIEHSNIPINLFDDMVDKLIAYNRYIIMNNDETQDSNHKVFISSDKIKYTQLVALYDINNNMLGFIAVEMSNIYSKDGADKEREVLDELSKQLVPVLSYSNYTSIKA